MPQVPMICNNCGHIFPSNIWIEGGAQVSIDGYSEYCPKCRSTVEASNGLYKEISNLITFLKTENTTVEDLRKIEIIFEKAQKNNLTKEEVIEQIEKEVPKLQKLKNYIKSDLRSDIGIFLALVQAINSFNSGHSISNTNINIDINIETIKIILERTFDNIYKLPPWQRDFK